MKSQFLFFTSIGIGSALLGTSVALVMHGSQVATAPPVSSIATAAAQNSEQPTIFSSPVSSSPVSSDASVSVAAEGSSRAWRDDQLQVGYDLNQLSQQLYQALHDPKAAALRALLSRQYNHCTEAINAASPQVDLETQARCQALLQILRQSEAFAPSPDSLAAPQP